MKTVSRMRGAAVLLVTGVMASACRNAGPTEGGAPSSSASAEAGRPAGEADFARVTQEQLQAALRAAGATVSEDGWLTLPPGKLVSLHEAHGGVAHKVEAVTAVRLRGRLLLARDRAGVEHQLASGDIFATSVLLPPEGDPRPSAAPTPSASGSAAAPPANPTLTLSTRVFVLSPTSAQRETPGFFDEAPVRSGYGYSSELREFGFGVIVEAVNESDVILAAEMRPRSESVDGTERTSDKASKGTRKPYVDVSGEVTIEGARGSLKCELEFQRLDSGAAFSSFSAPPAPVQGQLLPTPWKSWDDESKGTFVPFETVWRPKEQVRLVGRAERCGKPLSVYELDVASVQGAVSLSAMGVLPGEGEPQTGSTTFSFGPTTFGVQSGALPNGTEVFVAGGDALFFDASDIKRADAGALKIDLASLKPVPAETPSPELSLDELTVNLSGIKLTQHGDVGPGKRKGSRDLAIELKAHLATDQIKARLEAAVGAAPDAAKKAAAEAALKQGPDPERRRLSGAFGCDGVTLVTSMGKQVSLTANDDRTACAALATSDDVARTLHFALGRYEIPVGLLVRLGTQRFVPIASAPLAKFDRR
ncbi:MAG: hypothetical protein FJ095_16875 [Deltaproteobacteria bacterium]|nr:hypothetical protein [Deltaproteobacteria bacterium]